MMEGAKATCREHPWVQNIGVNNITQVVREKLSAFGVMETHWMEGGAVL